MHLLPDIRVNTLKFIQQAGKITGRYGSKLRDDLIQDGFLANLFTVSLALLAVSGLLIPALGFIRWSNNLVDNKD